jgi:hypothetical protein
MHMLRHVNTCKRHMVTMSLVQLLIMNMTYRKAQGKLQKQIISLQTLLVCDHIRYLFIRSFLITPLHEGVSKSFRNGRLERELQML